MEVTGLLGSSVWFIAKILVLFALLIYVVFAIIVVRQVQLMTQTLEVGFELPVKLLSYIHLLLALIIFIIAIFLLV